MKVFEKYSLKTHNTFNIDVEAELFTEIKNQEDLIELKDYLTSQRMPVLVLGGGSNILFTKDYNGLIIKNNLTGIEIIDEKKDSVIIEAKAGVQWDDFVLFAVENNLGGIENLTLIPGTVGASPIQNIGAYGQEAKDSILLVKGIDLEDFQTKSFTNEECRFGYRSSIFKSKLKGRFFITSVHFLLTKNPVINTSYGTIRKELESLGKNDPAITIKDVREAVISIRESKLPDTKTIGNAGSFFKNPSINKSWYNNLKKEFRDITGYETGIDEIKISAGWLIENAGLKGFRIGNAGVYEKQALVLVNYGSATGEEILNLSNIIKEKVKQKFGVVLQEEVNIH